MIYENRPALNRKVDCSVPKTVTSSICEMAREKKTLKLKWDYRKTAEVLHGYLGQRMKDFKRQQFEGISGILRRNHVPFYENIDFPLILRTCTDFTFRGNGINIDIFKFFHFRFHSLDETYLKFLTNIVYSFRYLNLDLYFKTHEVKQYTLPLKKNLLNDRRCCSVALVV